MAQRGITPESKAAAKAAAKIMDQVADLLNKPEIRAYGKHHSPDDWREIRVMMSAAHYRARIAREQAGEDPKQTPNKLLPAHNHL